MRARLWTTKKAFFVQFQRLQVIILVEFNLPNIEDEPVEDGVGLAIDNEEDLERGDRRRRGSAFSTIATPISASFWPISPSPPAQPPRRRPSST